MWGTHRVQDIYQKKKKKRGKERYQKDTFLGRRQHLPSSQQIPLRNIHPRPILQPHLPLSTPLQHPPPELQHPPLHPAHIPHRMALPAQIPYEL